MPRTKYADVMEGVYNEYNPKAMKLLGRVRDACVAAGLVADDPVDFSVDEYEWHVIVYRSQARDEQTSVVVSIEVVEERANEGGWGFGVNFALKVQKYGGVDLMNVQPYNYSPEVWVDARKPDLIAARWRLATEDVGVDRIPAIITKEG